MDIGLGPTSLPVSQLLICNCDYDACKIQLYSDLMDASEFEKRKDKYLPKTATEEHSQFQKFRAERVRNSTYTAHIQGLCSFLVSATLAANPSIVPESDKSIDYYLNLNKDIDGAGHSLTLLSRNALTEGITQGRAYLSIDFPEQEEAPDLKIQKENGSLDGKVCFIPASQIDDWECSEKGELLWARSHTIDFGRSNIFSPADIEVNKWTFITPKFLQTYSASRKIVDGKPEEWDKNAVAKGEEIFYHDLGALPLIPIFTPHIVGQLAPLALSLFAREASIDWFLSKSAYSQMVVTTDQPIGELVSSELSCIVLKPANFGKDVTFPSPNPMHYANLASSADKKQKDLFLALQSLILQQSSKASGPRQSGVAKNLEYDQVSILLAVLADALMDSLEKALNLIKKLRNENNLIVRIYGIDDFDLDPLDSKIGVLTALIGLPVPDSAKKYAIVDVCHALTQDADPDERQKIMNDAAAEDIEKEVKVDPATQQEVEKEVKVEEKADKKIEMTEGV